MKHCVKQSVKHFNRKIIKNGLTMRKPDSRGLVYAWLSEKLIFGSKKCFT